SPSPWLSIIFEPIASLNLVLPFGKAQRAQVRVTFVSEPIGGTTPVFGHGRTSLTRARSPQPRRRSCRWRSARPTHSSAGGAFQTSHRVDKRPRPCRRRRARALLPQPRLGNSCARRPNP